MKGLESLAQHPLAQGVKPETITSNPPAGRRKPVRKYYAALGEAGSKTPTVVCQITGVDGDIAELESGDGAIFLYDKSLRKLSSKKRSMSGVDVIWSGHIPPACNTDTLRLAWVKNLLDL